MPIFGYGDMRLYLLKLLAESPRYGYELIRLLEDRFLGAYVPSAGAVYPRLANMQEEGLIVHETAEGRKVYRLTEKGRKELEERNEEIEDLETRVSDWAGGLAESVIEGVRPLIEKIGVRLEDVGDGEEFIRRMAGRGDELSREIRRTREKARDRARHARHAEREARRQSRGEPRDAGPGLRGDLRAFVDEVTAAAREFTPDKPTRREVQRILLETRHRIADLLEERAPAGAGSSEDVDIEVEPEIEVEVETSTDD